MQIDQSYSRESPSMKSRRGKVLIKRSRWDAFALVSLAAWGGLSIYLRHIGQFKAPLLLAPLYVIVPWLLFRLTTPREGMYVRTIRGTPGAVVMLWSAAVSLGSMIALLVFDVVVLRHPLKAPLEAYHVLVFAPPSMILLAGAVWAGRIQNAADACDPADKDEQDA
ncbi:hypothetical protein OT109_14670 [Phycisphaeraceae bacterium D3-23]